MGPSAGRGAALPAAVGAAVRAQAVRAAASARRHKLQAAGACFGLRQAQLDGLCLAHAASCCRRVASGCGRRSAVGSAGAVLRAAAFASLWAAAAVSCRRRGTASCVLRGAAGWSRLAAAGVAQHCGRRCALVRWAAGRGMGGRRGVWSVLLNHAEISGIFTSWAVF